MCLLLCLVFLLGPVFPLAAQQKPRARALGVAPGTLPPGRLNSITDVAGVRVGQTTVQRGDSVRTGVTAILPHAGNLFFDRVPAAVYVGNGFGKLLGSTQVAELGELETPILLTCTLCVWKAADAMVAYLLGQPGMAEVRSIFSTNAQVRRRNGEVLRSSSDLDNDAMSGLFQAVVEATEEAIYNSRRSFLGAGRGLRQLPSALPG